MPGTVSEHDNNNATPPPAYFLSVSLENVRCFGPKQTLDLSDGEGRPAQWTIILGDNGTGKTTLLQAIAILEPVQSEKNPHVAGARFAYSRSDFSFGRGQTGDFDLSGEIAFGVCLTQREKKSNIRSLSIQKRDVLASGSMQRHAEIGGLICYAYGASRRMGGSGFGGSGEAKLDKVESLFDDTIELPNAEAWLLEAEIAAGRASEARKERFETRRSKIEDTLIGLLPDVDSIRFPEPADDPSWVPSTEFKTPYGWVRIDQLSLGYRTMIAWTVDVARRMFQRYPDSPNPLAEPAVVLVDEIDLHLHPRWQRDIIPFLSARFPNTQFIVTAHSPLIVQAAQDANIAVLRREGDHVVIEQDLKPLRNLRVDQILTSDLYGLESARPPHLDELLEQRRTLLSKSSLTAEDRRRLKEIEEDIGDMPAGETPEEMEAMDIIRQAAERLKEDA
jgi:hypothetical protein